MPIEGDLLADFSGGEVDIKSASEIAENQWALLKGFVLDRSNRLRAQWAGAIWDNE